MAKFAKDFLEITVFLLLTTFLYLLFTLTLPLFREPHGLLVSSDFLDFSRLKFFFVFLFGSSGVCVLLGVLLMDLAPIFSAGVMANLWASTYLFIWMDSVLFLFIQTKSPVVPFGFGIGLLFIYLFFFLLATFVIPGDDVPRILPWKNKLVSVWLWGWMGFYLGLSGFLVFYSFFHEGSRLPLAAASVFLCFLNYLLFLFIKKSEGKNTDLLSRLGRVVFTAWVFGLILVWLGRQWLI